MRNTLNIGDLVEVLKAKRTPSLVGTIGKVTGVANHSVYVTFPNGFITYWSLNDNEPDKMDEYLRVIYESD